MNLARATAVALACAIPAIGAAEPRLVGAADVHAALVGDRKVVLVDARTAAEYEQAHLPGAIHVPADQVRASAARLPRDKATPIIFYCRGGG